MEREKRSLYREGRREREEEQDAGRAAEVGVLEGRQCKREHPGLALVQKGHHQDPDQQEGRPEEGVHEELDGGVSAPREAPTADDEVGRNQGQLEEQEEEDEVQGYEAADAGRLQQQHPSHEG